MKLTKTRLRQIILEELQKILQETGTCNTDKDCAAYGPKFTCINGNCSWESEEPEDEPEQP